MVRKHGRGLALIAVVWLMAALSVAVLGLTRAVRDEARTASFQVARLQAAGIGDAAIVQVLQALHAEGRTFLSASERRSVAFAGIDVTVEVMPANGLINLELAPPSLLRDLFVHAAGLDEGAAQAVADAIVAWRTRPGPQGQPAGIDAPEELLQAGGVPYDVYDKIRDLVHSGAEGAGVNPRAAPPGVIGVLMQRQPSQWASGGGAREGAAADLTGVMPSHLDSTPTSRLFLAAAVPFQGPGTMRRRWLVQAGSSARTVPWKVISVQDAVTTPDGPPAVSPRP